MVTKDPGHGRIRDGEEEAHNRSMQRSSRSIPLRMQEERGQVGTYIVITNIRCSNNS